MEFPLDWQEFVFSESRTGLFVPDEGAVKVAWQQGLISFPYWSQVWPSAKALAAFIVSHPSFVRGKTVLEMGAGLGLPSLVAARFAKRVHCTDKVPEAVTIAAQSAAEARLKNFAASVLDWHQLPPAPNADVLLLSDINYEPEAFARLLAVIENFLSHHTVVLLSTPQRLLAKTFLEPLLAHCLQQNEISIEHKGEKQAITVVVLKKPASEG